MSGDRFYKYRFENDYSELAHPDVLNALSAAGTSQFGSYGLDEYSIRAGDLIRRRIDNPAAEVHFVSGGTMANLVVLSSILRPHEAVIAPGGGHIFVHETGAIEATGHKICTARGVNGKILPDEIEAIVSEHTDEHMVVPRVVYISQASEAGTVYTKTELTEISRCCRNNGLYLFLDGARIGAAINSGACDLSLADTAGLTDVFYIGGTKNGALFGEAVVICNEGLKADFRHLMKQRGALLAKGAVIGLQFEALFSDGLFDRLAKHACAMARKLADGFSSAGYDLHYPMEANMVFPVLPSGVAKKLHDLYSFHDWEYLGDLTAVRIVASWATPEYAVDDLLADLADYT